MENICEGNLDLR